MNDRYLFRAKRIDNGEFVIGSLVLSGDADEEYKAIIIPSVNSNMFTRESYNEDLGFENWYKVDQSTICQCTGLKDKNGNLIWENDVVKQFADCNELGNSLYFFYQIRWNNEYSAFEGYEIYTKETVLFPDLEDIEVIGNIFDNPELINE